MRALRFLWFVLIWEILAPVAVLVTIPIWGPLLVLYNIGLMLWEHFEEHERNDNA